MGMNEDLQKQLINDLLIESFEGLDRFDQYLLDLEKGEGGSETLNGIFRVIHTIKGTSGCIALTRIEKLAHVGENLLSLLRDGKLTVKPMMITALLRLSDGLRDMLRALERDGNEGTADYAELKDLLTRLQDPDAVFVEETRGSSWGLFDDDDVAPVTATVEAPAEPELACPVLRTESEQEPEAVPALATITPISTAMPVASESSAVTTPAAADTVNRAAGRASVADSAIRVDVGQLDRLMNLVGELVLARNQIIQHSHDPSSDGLHKASQRLNIITTELQESVMKTRMQPIGNVWSKFPRIVRDLASELGKDIHFVMEGNETELDRTIIEAIKDPLTHIVRNSVDHGIETPETRRQAGKAARGSLVMRAFHEGGQVIIEIIDDGRGIQVEKVVKKAVERGVLTADRAARLSPREAFGLIFAPGFSTAEQVTNVSGRGVGMDVVKTNIEKIGGSVDVNSESGRGTTIRIKIPLTLAIIPALVVSTGDERFAIPQVSLLELVRLEAEQARTAIEHVCDAPVYRLRGELLPLVYLDRALDVKSAAAARSTVNIVVLQADGRPFGLVVERVSDTAEIVVKPLGKQLKNLSCFAGATIMGDGHVALILDVLGLAQASGVISEVRESSPLEQETTAADVHDDVRTLVDVWSGSYAWDAPYLRFIDPERRTFYRVRFADRAPAQEPPR